MNSEELQGYCSDPEKDALLFLADAVEEAQAAYKDVKSSDQLQAYEAAQAAYEKKYAALVKKYTKQAEAKTVESWDDFEETKKVSELRRFLLALGYKVTERTLYRHAQNGTLRKNDENFFTKKLTRKYIRNEGLVSSRDKISLPDDAGATDKAVHDAEKSKWQARNEKQRFLKNAGKLGSRKEFDLQMAARLAVLDSSLRGFISQHGVEFIAIVGGNQDKKTDLADFWVQKLSEMMRNMAKPLDYKVIFKSDEGN